MTPTRNPAPIADWHGVHVAPGECRDVQLNVSESYSGMTLTIPLQVRRAQKEGPTLFVTAALHGDEINGTGAIRAMLQDDRLRLECGALILAPVLNILSFDRHSRYLPDRRDLNRCFPGSASGSLASRMARTIFNEIVARSDYGIDLHTAATRRTNFPNVRADVSNPGVLRLAKSFGCEVIVNGQGPKGALRREACAAGCPTIILEAGEVCKVEPAIVEIALRGIRNVMIELGMLNDRPVVAPYEIVVEKTKWIRADRGGFMQFHIRPGDIVRRNAPLATNTSLLGRQQNVLTAPFDAIVIGINTLPAVSPGEPVCHLGRLTQSAKRIERIRKKLAGDSLHERVISDLATNVLVVEGPDE